MSGEQELLTEAAIALRSFALRALAVKPSLSVPYPDAPGHSPWTMVIEAEARRAHDLACKIRKHLADEYGATLPPAAECHAPRLPARAAERG